MNARGVSKPKLQSCWMNGKHNTELPPTLAMSQEQKRLLFSTWFKKNQADSRQGLELIPS